MKNVLFAVAAVIVFGVSVSLGYKLAVLKYENEHYGYWNVKWDESVGTYISDLKYGDKELNNYDLYLPKVQKQEYSMILYIHGGGFTHGDKTDAKHIGRYYAAKGYVVASVNYSLNEVGADYKLIEKNEEISRSLTEIVNETEKRGYHLKKFATTGDSAGGYLALMLALREPENLEIPVRFAFVSSAPACFEPLQWGAKDPDEQIRFVNSMYGRQLDLKPDDVESEAFAELVKNGTPDRWVNENSCPMVLAYGANDKIVPTNLKYHLIEALDENNITYEFIEFPNSGHGLAGDPEELKKFYTIVDDYVGRYFS